MLANLRTNFSLMSGAKKVVFLVSLVFLTFSALSFGYVVYLFLRPASASNSARSGTEAVSPVTFFGQASRAETSTSSRIQKTVPSPLNGLLYSEAEAKEWLTRRPMAVMINNHVDARPQWNLALADIVYEAVAEGGIPRFLAIYHSKIPDKAGPVRSARRYYVDFAKEYDAWYAHWGGASTENEANVYNYMRTIFVSSIDGINYNGPGLPFDRDPQRLQQVAVEHTGYAKLPEVYQKAYSLYPDQVKEFRPIEAWKFKEDPPETARPASASVQFNFWDLPEYGVKWQYEPKTNDYVRSQGGKVQVDAVSGEPLRAKNVVVEFMNESELHDEKAHLLYKTLGQGLAKVFLDGKVIEASWTRSNLSSRTKFYEASGAEVVFDRGQTWLEVLPVGNTLTYN